MLTTGDVGRDLGVTINTVKSWIRAGRLRALRLPSGHFRIPAREMGRFRRTLAPAGEAIRERRRQWGDFEAWRLSEPPEVLTPADALAWADSMLEIALLEPIPDRPIEAEAENVAALHRAFSVLGA